MDRRSFVLSLFGGLAAAAIGGASLAQAAVPAATSPVPNPEDLAPELKAGLDKTEADFSQAVVRRTTVVRRPVGYRRPVVVRRTTVVHRRPTVVRRTTVVRRPPAYRRPVVVRRTTIVR